MIRSITLKSAAAYSHRFYSGLARFTEGNALASAAWALPLIPVAWFAGGLGVLQGIYAKYYGMSLVSLAAIMLYVRIFDGVADLVAGYWSDRLQQRKGTRKPLIIIGALLLAAGGFLLFAPIHISVWYVAAALTLFYAGLTLFLVPHYAWGSDLAPTSSEKTKIFTARGITTKLGWVVFFTVPLLPFFETQEITPATLKVTAVGGGILLLVSIVLCLRLAPDPASNSAVRDAPQRKKALEELAFVGRSVVKNWPLQMLLGTKFLYFCGHGMWMSLFFLFADAYLGLGAVFAQIYLIALLVGLAATQGWSWFALRYGKKLGLCCGLGLLVVAYLYLGALTPEMASFQHLVAVKIIATIALANMIILLPAYMSELVDYSTLKFRSENAGSYFAVYSFIEKVSVAIGMSAGLAVAGALGFDATVTAQDASGEFGIKAGAAWIPLLLTIAACGLVIFNPITERRHEIIRKRLDSLTRRKAKD